MAKAVANKCYANFISEKTPKLLTKDLENQKQM